MAVILRDRFSNKSTAYTAEERRALGVCGRLPAAIETLESQVKRCELQFASYAEPIHKYQFLRSLQNTNTVLYYALILKNLAATLPIIYTPTVGLACQRFSDLYTFEQGIYVKLSDMGRVQEVLRSVATEADIIVVTDGSRILGLGDLGSNGMGIPIGKASLYVAGAGIDPRRVLPVLIDVGTNNAVFREHPLYLGLREPRCADGPFYKLMDEFMQAAAKTFPTATIQFEDFSNNHCFDMLDRYRDSYRCFNDDIQGTGAVVAAGLLNAFRLVGTPLSSHRIVVFGAGSAAVGVVESIASLLSAYYSVPRDSVVKLVYLVDTEGLVTTGRGGRPLANHKKPFARVDVGLTPSEHSAKWSTLESIADGVGATALIGLAGVGPSFTEGLVKRMAQRVKRPILFALSNPTSKSEITAADAFTWTNGTAVVSTGSPFDPVTLADGRVKVASQGNNMYVFPGVGLAATLSQATSLSDAAMTAAASALAAMVPDADLERGLYPSLADIRRVSAVVAAAVMAQVAREGKSATIDRSASQAELVALAQSRMWNPVYASTASIAKSKSKL